MRGQLLTMVDHRKKVCQKQVFINRENIAFFIVLDLLGGFVGKMPKFAGLRHPNQQTLTAS